MEGARGAYLRGRPRLLRREQAALEGAHRAERTQVAAGHGSAVREIEQRGAETYRRQLEGSETQAEAMARDERSGRWRYDLHSVESFKMLREYVDEARWDQVRETEGEAGVQRQKQTEAEAREVARARSRPRLRTQQVTGGCETQALSPFCGQSTRRPASRSSTWCGRRPIGRRCEGLSEAEGSSGDVALGSPSLPSLVVSAGAPVDS